MSNQHSRPSPAAKVQRSVPASPMLDELQPARATELPMTPDTIMSLQRTIGNQAVLRMLSGGQNSAAAPHHVQRQAAKTAPPTLPATAGNKAPILDADEAAHLVELSLFDSAGYFATTKETILEFQRNMTTAVGHYAGDKKKKKDPSAVDATADMAKGKAKDLSKKALTTLITAFGVSSGGAGLAATAAIAGIQKLLTDNYEPSVIVPTEKPPYEHYVADLLELTNAHHEALRLAWVQSRTELIKERGAAGLKQLADEIKKASETLRQRLYTEIVAAYLSYAPQRSANPETPHSEYTGKKQGVIDFFGHGAGAHYATKINPGEIYVEIDATKGIYPGAMKIKRTIVPQLPSGVTGQLNDPKRTKGQHLYDLPYTRVIMEADAGRFPARVVFNWGGKLDIAQHPSYSGTFCRAFARAYGVHSDSASPGGEYTTQEFAGANNLWGWVLQHELHEMNFSA